MIKQIKIKLPDNSYSVFLGNDPLSEVINRINALPIDKCLVVIDRNVYNYHSLLIKKYFANINCKSYVYIFTATEKNKNFAQVQKIEKQLSDYNFSRNSVIVAIGGGLTGDVVGFAASIFMRGIRFIQIPTTLLAMVDSSVGGKTGVNFDKKKNFIGTFYQPDSVFINPDFLSTLPQRELISGAGEIFKYAFLADAKNYKKLKLSLYKLFTGENINFNSTIKSCIEIKSNIVMQDEKEITGLRKILNLGHTFAHAFEVTSYYKLKHGEAVIGGIFCALFISEYFGLISKNMLFKYLSDFYFIKLNRIFKSLPLEEIYKSMLSDKKNIGNKIRLVLLADVGNIVVDVISEKPTILESLERLKWFVDNQYRFKRGKLSDFEGEI